MYKESTEKAVKIIPEAANIGIYPMDSAANPANNTEVNSANLTGMLSNPMSMETFTLSFEAFAITASRKPHPRPRAKASIKKGTRK